MLRTLATSLKVIATTWFLLDINMLQFGPNVERSLDFSRAGKNQLSYVTSNNF